MCFFTFCTVYLQWPLGYLWHFKFNWFTLHYKKLQEGRATVTNPDCSYPMLEAALTCAAEEVQSRVACSCFTWLTMWLLSGWCSMDRCNWDVMLVGCRFTGTLGVSYLLDAEKLSSVRPARAVFPRRDSRGRTVEEPTIAASLTMYEQWRATNICNNHLVYVSVSSHSLLYFCHCHT